MCEFGLFKQIVTGLGGNGATLVAFTQTLNEELNKTAKWPISSMGIIRTSESPPRTSGD